ncbi:mCG1030192 [Mus musculus]|nr:mCG1030192 [Mus musculus]
MQCPHLPEYAPCVGRTIPPCSLFPPEGGPGSTSLLLGAQTICSMTGTSLILSLGFYADPLEASGPVNVSMTSYTRNTSSSAH